MSATVLYMSMSLDGFMAGPDNDLDFMVDDPQLEDELTGMLMSVADTIVVGRKAFPDMAAYWTTADGDLAAWMNATPKVVLTTDRAGYVCLVTFVLPIYRIRLINSCAAGRFSSNVG